jgi:DNA-binding transcriptional LysR family regulator
MPRPDINRAAEMEVFVQVQDRGGFSAAARALGMTPSAVSKLVGRLEARLGAQLVQRSTRKLQLTAEGERFYERALRVLADIDEAERCVGAHAAPRGRVVLNTSVAFGVEMLLPLVPKFRAQHPELALDIALTDRVVDLLEERADIAIRWGRLPSSDLVARHLGDTVQHIVASPDYLARHGTPRKPRELDDHERLDFTYRRRVPHWTFVSRGETVEVPVRASVRASDGEGLRQLALAGAGLAWLSHYHVARDLQAGRLVAVLEKYNPREPVPISAVYLGKPGHLPPRVRVVLDFLADEFRRDPRLEAA